MNIKQFLKIARQIYKIASEPLPQLQLPDTIEKESLQCFYDYINNNGQKGEDLIKKIDNVDIHCKHYIIDNVKEKCKDWYLYDQMKDRFNNQINLFFCNRQYIAQPSLINCDHDIVISTFHDHQDYISLIHELQHYFQHVILDQQKLKQLTEQAKKIGNQFQYLLSKGQRIEQIGNCCQRFFDLYMKSYYKDITFEQFYQKYIENSPFFNIERLKSRRFQNYANLSLIFLSMIKSKQPQEYLKIKDYIINYANKKLKQQNNLQKIFQSKNYFVLQNLVLENHQDQNFMKKIIDFLLENKKYKLLSAIIEHFELFDLINLNEFSNYQLLVIVCNFKSEQSKNTIIKLIKQNNNIETIHYFVDNIDKLSDNITYKQKFKHILIN